MGAECCQDREQEVSEKEVSLIRDTIQADTGSPPPSPAIRKEMPDKTQGNTKPVCVEAPTKVNTIMTSASELLKRRGEPTHQPFIFRRTKSCDERELNMSRVSLEPPVSLETPILFRRTKSCLLPKSNFSTELRDP